MSRWSELWELTRVRTVLFVREPEAMFWVFVFPLILAAVLGFAFRNTGPSPSRVVIISASGDEAAADRLAESLEGDELLEVLREADLDARHARSAER